MLESLVQFATPEDWTHLQENADSFYPITFRERKYELLQGKFNGRAITINIPDLLDLPFYGNRAIRKARGPAVLGGGYLPDKYQLPKKEQLPLTNFTEWLLTHIAHEIHHAYLRWINPQNYVDATRSLTAEAEQDKDSERYAIKVVKKWREKHGRKDLPFPQLKGIRKRVHVKNTQIDEAQRKFDNFLDKSTTESTSS